MNFTLQSLINMGEKISQSQYISKIIEVPTIPINHEEPNQNLMPLQNQKFIVQKESFNKTYLQSDHLQQFYNKRALNHFVQTITHMYGQNYQPISILDVCCGHGKPTQALKEMLQNNGVQIEKIVGYDVSEAMINFANENNKCYPKVQFYKKNIETQLAEVSQYEVVICLFGLHWMNNLQGTVAAIHRALRPGGLFLTLTPLGMQDLFACRQKFINESRWTSFFTESARQLHPFHERKQDYLVPFTQYFTHVYSQKKDVIFMYTRDDFISFLQSWLQEIRNLTSQLAHHEKGEAGKAYLNGLIQSIERNVVGNVNVKDNGMIVLTHPTFEFDGRKI